MKPPKSSFKKYNKKRSKSKIRGRYLPWEKIEK